MTKVNLGKEVFVFSPDMDLDRFTEANEAYYFKCYEEAHEDEPQKLFAARDGDFDDMREWVLEDKWQVMDLMTELYREYLSLNYA